MKTKFIILLFLVPIFINSCRKCINASDCENVDDFVSQIKEGVYDDYEVGENGEKLWLKMPEFEVDDIDKLLKYATDTSKINQYPINPISSRTPYPNGRNYFVLAECILWTIEGIRNGNRYGSLDPYLVDISINTIDKGISNKRIIEVGIIYKNWFYSTNQADLKNQNPLDKSTFRWH